MKRAVFLSLGIVVFWVLGLWAVVPKLINFQGILKDGSGNPVANGPYSVLFNIYNAPTGGSVLWSETQSVTTSSGLFTILLGNVTPIPDTLFNDSSRYLGIRVGADPEMTPRQKLSSVGFSYVSGQWSSLDSNLFRLKGNVGIGTAPSGGAKLDVGDFGSDPVSVIAIRSQAENSSSGDALGGYFVASTDGTGAHYGVYGQSDIGVFGTSADGYGLWGTASGGIGVYGNGTTGVYATSSISLGTGVYGESRIGVEGASLNSGYGVFGVAPGGIGVYGDGGTGGTGVYGNGSSYAGYFDGNLLATGTKTAAVKVDGGDYRLLYAEEATENWFEDFGTAQLVKGRAVVNLDPLYAQTVNTSIAYHVFLTPEGDCHGLYVGNKTPDSFEIRELQNGRSDIFVSYRIVAKRKGYEHTRLAKLAGSTPEEMQARQVNEQARFDVERRHQEEQRAKMEKERLRIEQKTTPAKSNK